MAEARGDLERIELWALRDVFAAAPATLGTVLEEVDGVTLMLSPVGRPQLFNRALGAGLDGPVAPRTVERLCEIGARHGLPWSLSLWPDAEPLDLEDTLLARGFSRGYAWMKFRRALERVPPVPDSDLRVDLATVAQGADFARLVRAGFELPTEFDPWLARLCGREGWDVLIAHDGGQPVATGASFSRDGLAWLGFAATLPSHRRWGGQGALLATALHLLRERGIHTAVVETGERVADKPSASYRNILRYGFEEAYPRQNLLCPAVERRATGAVDSAASDVR